MDILFILCAMFGLFWFAVGLRLTLLILYSFAWFLPLFAVVLFIFFLFLFPVIDYLFGDSELNFLYYLFIYFASAIVSFLISFLYVAKRVSFIRKPYFFIDKHFGYWWLKK